MPVRKESINLISTYNMVVETNRSYLFSQNVVGRDFRTYDPSLGFYFQPQVTSTDAQITAAAASNTPMKLRGAGAVSQWPSANVPGVAAQDMYLLGGFGKYSPYYTSTVGATKDNTYVFMPSGSICQVLPSGAMVQVRIGTSLYNATFDATRSYTYVFFEDDSYFYVIEKQEVVNAATSGVYQSNTPVFVMGRIAKVDWVFTALGSGNTTYSGFPVPIKETENGILFYPCSRGTYNTSRTINTQSAIYFSKSSKTTAVVSVIGVLSDKAADSLDAINPTKCSTDTTVVGSDKFYALRYYSANQTYQLSRVNVDSNVVTTGSLDSASQYTPCSFTNVPASISITGLLQSLNTVVTGGSYSNINRFLHYFKDSSGSEYLMMCIHQVRDGSNSAWTNLTPGSEQALVFKISQTNSASLEFKQMIKLAPNTIGIIPSNDGTFLLTVTPYSMQLLNWAIDAAQFSKSVQVNFDGKLLRYHLDSYNQIWAQYDNKLEVYHPSASKYVKVARQNPDEALFYVDTPITSNLVVGMFDIAGRRVAQDVTLRAVNCKFAGNVSELVVTTTTAGDSIVPITMSAPGSVSVIVTKY